MKVCYFGDHVVQDIVSTASRGWDAVAVVPALRHLGLCVVTPPLLPVHPGPPPTAGPGPAKGAHAPKKLAGASAGGAGAGTGVTSAPISAASGAGVDEGGPHTSPSVRRLGCGFVAALPSLSCAVLNINATLAIPSLDFLAANSSGPGTAPAVWTVKHVLTAFAVPPTLLDAPAPGAKGRSGGRSRSVEPPRNTSLWSVLTAWCKNAFTSGGASNGEDVSGSTSQFLDVFDGEGAVVARVPADGTGAWVAHAALVATATAAVVAATAAPLPVADSEVL